MKKTFSMNFNNNSKTTSDLKKKFGSGTPKFTFSKETKTKESFVDIVSSRSKSKDLKNNPGPGKYEPSDNYLKRNPKWKYLLNFSF